MTHRSVDPYGADHRKRRAEWALKVKTGACRCVRCGGLIAADMLPCPRCGKPTRKGGAASRGYCGWDLGHLDGTGRRLYAGPEHACCNRQTRTHAKQRGTVRPRVSRDW